MTLINRRNLFVLGAAAGGVLAAPAVLRAQTRNIADTLAADTRFQRLLDLITRDSLVEQFRQPGPMTVFAPIDSAFNSAPAGLMQDLLNTNEQASANRGDRERERLTALINYHVVNGRFMAEELMGQNRNVNTMNGGALQLSSSQGGLTVRNPSPATQLGSVGAAGAQASFRPANVVQPNIIASNGVIHAIDQVLFP